MTSWFRCYSKTDVNQTYFFDKFIQSLVMCEAAYPTELRQ